MNTVGSIEWCKTCSDEEAERWIFEVPLNSKEFIRRHNIIRWDYGLTRAGILVKEPSHSGELKIYYNE